MTRDVHQTIGRASHHFGWDNTIAPMLTIAPGTTVVLELNEASCGHITPTSRAQDLLTFDFDLANPLTGPIAVDGAEPGDVLKIEVLGCSSEGWGWTGIIPDFGLLSDQFPDPSLYVWSFDKAAREPAMFGRNARVPLKLMIGAMGVALAEPGAHSVLPPRRVGGTMDIRDLSAGSCLYLPVEVNGALFSAGDPHQAQGDGEVCGSAIEGPLTAAVRIDLVKQTRLDGPRFTTSGPVTNHLDQKGYDVTTGIGQDLMSGARQAVSEMILLLSARHAISSADAYMLCSVCGDLRISEIVDVPNWVVSFYFPRCVFE